LGALVRPVEPGPMSSQTRFISKSIDSALASDAMSS